MKILRFFPILALGFLAFIAYGLYKTGSFINKTVNKETLLAQDSLVKHANDKTINAVDTTLSLVASPTAPLSSTATSVSTIATPKDVAAQQTTSEIAASPTTTVATSLAAPTVEEKKVAKKEVPKGEKMEAKKPPPTKSKKTVAAHKDSAIMQPNAQTLKAANALAKKEASDVRFYVIVGTYSVEANAKTRAAEFEQKNNKKPTIVKEGKYFRVSANSFEFAQAAAQYAQKLKEAGEENIIVKF